MYNFFQNNKGILNILISDAMSHSEEQFNHMWFIIANSTYDLIVS